MILITIIIHETISSPLLINLKLASLKEVFLVQFYFYYRKKEHVFSQKFIGLNFTFSVRFNEP